MTTHHTNYEHAVKKIIDRIGKDIVMAVPLGIGKPIGLINALYTLAKQDDSIHLTIITGLTLARPSLHHTLEKRFAAPILERILKNYEDPLYEQPRRLQQLPKNIQIIEFFLAPGAYLNNSYVQQNYVSCKYTSVVQCSSYYHINLFAQQVAHSKECSTQYSLSCNTDIFRDLLKHLQDQDPGLNKKAIVAEVNQNLPFMTGEAIVEAPLFTDIIDTGEYKSLFALPRDKLSAQDHLIGLYTSTLIKDDSCLQIGIGKMGNAIANALILRHKDVYAYKNILQQLQVSEKFKDIIHQVGATTSFDKGLYASSEMISDEFMQLYKAGILKKHVYDHVGLQRLLNEQKIGYKITSSTLDILLDHHIISPILTDKEVSFLQEFGVFKSSIFYESGYLILPNGEKILADLSTKESKLNIIHSCLGTHLQNGKIIHAGFFLGSTLFYEQLRHLSEKELASIEMTAIARTNTLSWSPELLKLQRQNARFVNSTMMITLSGAVISDGLENLQEVSGVGGQFDFVNMAQEIENARSIINCRSTRLTQSGLQSNIVWDYANNTISRYLRDIFVTEYGIADCRNKTDAEVIKCLLNITDSRFQAALLKKAKRYGKVSKDYEIPELFKQNLPEYIYPVFKKIQAQGYCQSYPFGSDLTKDEEVLEKVLVYLSKCSYFNLFILSLKSFFLFANKEKFQSYLTRMGLEHPKTLGEFFYKKLLVYMFAKKLHYL